MNFLRAALLAIGIGSASATSAEATEPIAAEQTVAQEAVLIKALVEADSIGGRIWGVLIPAIRTADGARANAAIVPLLRELERKLEIINPLLTKYTHQTETSALFDVLTPFLGTMGEIYGYLKDTDGYQSSLQAKDKLRPSPQIEEFYRIIRKNFSRGG